ncbi:MAG: hypothetical protein V3V33_05335 [Candidatus Lokiarchaeia archaeon]
MKCSVVKADFSGEAIVLGGDKEDALNEKETKTIHPNRFHMKSQIFLNPAAKPSRANLNSLLESQSLKI